MPTIKAHIIDLMSDCKERHFREVTDIIIARGAIFNHKSPKSNPSATVSSTMYRENDIFDALGGGVYRMRDDYKKLLTKKLIYTSSPKQKIKNTTAKIEPISKKLPKPNTWKSELYIAQRGICNGCYKVFEKSQMVIDHIIPKTKDGTDYYDNLQLLCGNCNSKKGTLTMHEWTKNTNWFLNVVEAHLKHGDEYVKRVDRNADVAGVAIKLANI